MGREKKTSKARVKKKYLECLIQQPQLAQTLTYGAVSLFWMQFQVRCLFFSENPWLTGGAISSSRDQ